MAIRHHFKSGGSFHEDLDTWDLNKDISGWAGVESERISIAGDDGQVVTEERVTELHLSGYAVIDLPFGRILRVEHYYGWDLKGTLPQGNRVL